MLWKQLKGKEAAKMPCFESVEVTTYDTIKGVDLKMPDGKRFRFGGGIEVFIEVEPEMVEKFVVKGIVTMAGMSVTVETPLANSKDEADALVTAIAAKADAGTGNTLAVVSVSVPKE